MPGITLNGPRVRELRKKWTQEEFSGVAGVSVDVISNAERGRPVALDSTRAIAAALNVNLDTLVAIDPQTHAAKDKAARDAGPVRIQWNDVMLGVKHICELVREDEFAPAVFIASAGGGAILASLIALELAGGEDATQTCKPLYVIEEILGEGNPFDSSSVLVGTWEVIRWYVSGDLRCKPSKTKALLVHEFAVTGGSIRSMKDKLASEFDLEVKGAALLCNIQAFKLSEIPGVELIPDYYYAVENSTNFDMPWYQPTI